MNHDHDMPMAKCSMHMLWNTQIQDTCIVFESWHISSTFSFVVSFFVVVAIGVFYEWLRSFQKAFDKQLLYRQSKGKVRLGGNSRDGSLERSEEDTGLLDKPVALAPVPKVIRSLLYAVTVFISFFLMLVFMTYNAYLILAVVIGAGVGHYLFAGLTAEGDSKGVACH